MPISSALGSSALLPAGLGFRNKLINGDMSINQRSSGVITGSGTRQWPVDQWAVWNGTGTVTFQQSSIAPAGFSKSLLATVSSTGSYGVGGYTQIQHKVEGNNCRDLNFGTTNAKTLIFSFWCKASVTGTYCVAFHNSAFDLSYVATFAVSSTDWEYKVIQIPGCTTGTWLTNNGIGLEFSFNLGLGTTDDTTTPNTWISGNKGSIASSVDFAANSGATFYLTGVQLEANYQSTPFEQRNYGIELSLCQRYYYRYANPSGNGGAIGYIAGFSSTRSFGTIHIPVEMRGTITITPSGCQVDTLGLSNAGNVTAVALYPTVGNAPYTTTLFIDCVTTGTVAGTLYFFRVPAGASLQFSAEL